MTPVSQASEVFERELLPLRGKILEVASALDRIAQAAGPVEEDPRYQQIAESLKVLAAPGRQADRTERIQLVFSLPYDPEWRKHAAG